MPKPMCLTKFHEYPKIAKQPIVCYKVLSLTVKGEDIVLRSPYFPAFTWKPNVTATASHNPKDYDKANLGFGFFHSCSYRTDAINYMKLHFPYQKVELWRCLIPAGTEYFEGNHGNKFGYASRKLILIKKEMDNEVLKLKKQDLI